VGVGWMTPLPDGPTGGSTSGREGIPRGVFGYSVYGLLRGMRGSRTISQTRGLSGCGCSRPCATRISAERIAASRLWRTFGPQIRMSRELTVGLGHLSSHPKSASACSFGCCLAFSSPGAAGRCFARWSKMLVIVIILPVGRREHWAQGINPAVRCSMLTPSNPNLIHGRSDHVAEMRFTE
jgi:hypothetical protein